MFVTAAVLAYGTVVHVSQLLAGGWDPYPSVPGWLAVYFVCLTVLDPLAAALLLLRRRAGLMLGCAVLVIDAVANGYPYHAIDASVGLTPQDPRRHHPPAVALQRLLFEPGTPIVATTA